jgi:hypothetical protein
MVDFAASVVKPFELKKKDGGQWCDYTQARRAHTAEVSSCIVAGVGTFRIRHTPRSTGVRQSSLERSQVLALPGFYFQPEDFRCGLLRRDMLMFTEIRLDGV